MPDTVVLSSCEGGALASPGRASGLGVGPAFLIAGAREVLVATRAVDDRAAEALFAAFYATPARDGLAARLREARASVRGREPQSDLSVLRVLVP